ncbi:tetrapyrrole methylase [Tirmania nivea]|nr:tetrapyrrole methylase [Tirmania nivea]
MPSLLIATDCTSHIHLIVGHTPLASSRATRSLELGARVKLLAPADAPLHYNLTQKISEGAIEWIQKDEVTRGDLTTLGREEVEGVVDAVFVTLSVGCAQMVGGKMVDAQISALCKKLRIPVNVADSPSLCSFTLLSTYTDGPLNIGVTTSGRGCKLASRIRREIVSCLPPRLGETCDRFGRLRRRIWEEDYASEGGEVVEEDDDLGQGAGFNKLVVEDEEGWEERKGRRIRWLSQMCEYWPLERLCALEEGDVEGLLEGYKRGNSAAGAVAPAGAPLLSNGATPSKSEAAVHAQSIPPPPPSHPKHGKILLVGSGPGHPDLLTTAALNAITSADLILADKLVPPPVLALIPRRTPVHIARKFPGNADAAQEELLALGLSALQTGKMVVRLKQGDPYIYGRGGEEYLFFSAKGYTPIVVPGITSALSAGVFAGIPLTHRSVCDQVLICTGTGRKGELPVWPEYVRGRTTVLLMALHRLREVVEGLKSRGWEAGMGCAVVERASCGDQRVVRSTLGEVVAAVEEVGSRPPGLLIVGEACRVLGGVPEGKRWVERVRKQAAKEEIRKEFLRDLANLGRRKKVTPDNIWNCDEKGITMGRGGQREKAIVRAGRKEAMALSEGSREFVSVLETISVAGHIISPFIIYQGKIHRVSYYLNGLSTTARSKGISQAAASIISTWRGVECKETTFTVSPNG